MKRCLKILLGFAVVILAGPGLQSQAADTRETSIETVAKSVSWLRLLHYRSGMFGAAKSEIDGREFFLSPFGRTDARAELEASLEAFRRPATYRIGRYEQHPQCVYPARFQYLREQGLLEISSEGPAEIECSMFRAWKKGLAARSVSLVFAAPYLGNPASMFGHTFLRFRSGGSSGGELLDAAISFDAVSADDNFVSYAIKGIAGGYQGLFSVQPFYLKVDAYGRIENRDLWEYELNLDPEQVERLVAHLWELGSTYFDYYFFDDNCSYQLVALLEVAAPSWNLRDRFYFMTVPLDTVRAVGEQPSAIRSMHRRPALAAELERRIADLSNDDRISFHRVRGDSSQFVGTESVDVLDALLDWQKYQMRNRTEGGQPFDSDFEQRLLLARAGRAVASPGKTSGAALPVQERGAALPVETSHTVMASREPQSGHRSSKVSFTGVRENGSSGFGLELRPAVHDRLEPSVGYAPYSTLIVAQAAVDYFPGEGKVALRKLTFAEVENLRPMTDLRRNLSWIAGVSLEKPTDNKCLDCLAGRATFGVGASSLVFSRSTLISLLGKLRPEFSDLFVERYGQSFRIGSSIETRALFNADELFMFDLSLEQFWFVSRVDRDVVSMLQGRAILAVPLRSSAYELRLSAELSSQLETYRLSIGHFF